MKHIWQEKWKKVVSVMLAVVMALGLWPTLGQVKAEADSVRAVTVNEEFKVEKIAQESIYVVKLYGTSAMPVPEDYPWNKSITPYLDGVLTYQTGAEEPVELKVDIRRPNAGYYYMVLGEKNPDLSIQSGDTLRISGKFCMNDYYIEFAPTELKYTDSGWTLVSSGFYDDITLTGVSGSTQYVPAHNGWFLYLTSSATLPGTNDSTLFKGLTMQVADGEPFAFNFNKTGNGKTTWSLVSNTNLPQTLPEDTKIVIKAGRAESNDGSHGIHLTEDFAMYVKGNGFTTQVPPEEYQEVVIGSVHVQGNASGWDYRLVLTNSVTDPDGSTWGPTYDIPVRINDVNYDATVNMCNRSDEISFYLGASGPALSDGMTMIIKGGNYKSSTGEYGINITKDFAFQWDAQAGEWKEIIPDSGVASDVNGDGVLDPRDLVRLLCYQKTGAVVINEKRADINLDGKCDGNDISSIRKVLAGALNYGSSTLEMNAPTGIPIYSTAKTVERTALVSPSTADFQKYKDAGFTLLETQVAMRLNTDELNETKQVNLVNYLKEAQKYGLGVVVFSEHIYNMIVDSSMDSYYYGENELWKTLLREQVKFLKKYPAFKGFFLGDEVSRLRVEKYSQVAAYLLELDPNLILLNSQLGLYHTQASDFSDSITDKKEAYLDYVDKFSAATGRFNYDIYTLLKKVGEPSDIYSVNDNWYTNLSYVGEYVKAQMSTRQVKTGITIQACQPEQVSASGAYRYAPTQKADIGFQVYTAMAYGMDEINYYKYQAHAGDSGASNCIADDTGVYNAVKAVNAELSYFGYVFKAFTWKGTLDIAAGDSITSTGNARLAKATSSGARAFVGCMKDADSFDGYMVANAEGPRSGKTSTVTLTFNSATKAMIYKGTTCTMVSLGGSSACTITLNAGEGAFVIPVR